MAAAYRGDTVRAMFRPCRACLAIAIAWAPLSALAAPGGDPTVGRAVFTGAVTPHATSVSLNPSAMGLGTTDELYVAATAVIDQIAINRRDLDVATGDYSDGQHVRDVEIGPGGAVAVMYHAIE